MKNISKKLLFRLSILTAILGSHQIAYATVGANDFGYGNINKGMAGTGVAFPTDSFTSAINPAAEVYVRDRADLGLTIFSPRRGYSANSIGAAPFGVAPGSHSSDRNYFFLPNVGYVGNFANNKAAWGVSLYGNGGMNTAYPSSNITGSTIGFGPGVYAAGPAGIDLKQIFVNLSIAWEAQPNFSIGASLIPAMQVLSVTGVSNFAPFSDNPSNLSDRNDEIVFGIGGRVGAMYKPNACVGLGIAYQPKISMGKVSRYSGFLPNSGSLDIPANGTIGISLLPIDNVNVNFDVQHIWYSLASAYSNKNSCSGGVCLGVPGGAGFGWDNPTAYKLGAEWRVNDAWAVRAGYVYNNQVVPSSQTIFNILAPAVVQNQITAGFTHDFSRCFALNVSGMYAPKTTVSGPNQFNPAQDIKLYMYQYELGASLSWKLV